MCGADVSPNEMCHPCHRHSKVRSHCGPEEMELAKCRKLATKIMQPSSLFYSRRETASS